MGKKAFLGLALVCLLVGSSSVVGAASQESSRCSRAGKVIKVSDVKLVCGRVNRKLSWILISNYGAGSKKSSRCSKAGKVINVFDLKIVCGRVNRKLSWILISKAATTSQVVSPSTTATTVATTTTTTTATTTTVSTAIPKIVSVAFRQPDADGTYNIGQFVRVAFTFSIPVVVSGSPYVMLDASTIGKTPFLDGNGTTGLMFSYTVVAGDVESGVGLIANSFVLNGGTIKSLTGVSADLTHSRISRSGTRLVGP